MKKTTFVAALMLALAGGNAGAYDFDKPLYGAAYYSEYTPTDRLDEDIRLMREAGVTVVRVGESTWSLFEPQDGVFRFEWMDHILDRLHKAGIKVILGTPTYSIPAWMAASHPEVLSQRWDGKQEHYGIRQNMDIYNPTYRRYSERIIRKMMEHFAGHPAIIGYQVDNEVEARKIGNRDYFEGFREYIRSEFGDSLEELNRRWGLNYWGMNINTWDEFYDRPGVTNPSYKLWWERWNRKVTADFLNWQADIVNEYRRPDQFVTHCFMPYFYNIDQVEAFRQMDYPAINIYYTMQDAQDGMWIAYAGDFMRPVCRRGNFLVTETNAQGTGWSSRDQYPPYDGQLRQNMYAMLASGANMVEYWHWATLHYGQETYWRGLLGHDGQPNRVYAEFARGAAELEKVGKKLVNLKKRNRVAMLFSHDSKHALDFMPYTNGDQYKDYMVYEALYRQNIECDILVGRQGERLQRLRHARRTAALCGHRRDAAAHQRLRGTGRRGGHALQERLLQRGRRRQAGARPGAAGGRLRLHLPGVLVDTQAQPAPKRHRGCRQYGRHVDGIPVPHHGQAAGLRRPRVLRQVAVRHRKQLRKGPPDVHRGRAVAGTAAEAHRPRGRPQGHCHRRAQAALPDCAALGHQWRRPRRSLHVQFLGR